MSEKQNQATLTAEQLLKLQNGSDIRGVAVPGVPEEPVSLTGEAVERITAAFVRWLSAKTKKSVDQLHIGVGHDPRISSKPIMRNAVNAVAQAGAKVTDCWLASTPAMYMSLLFEQTAFDGSIMVTASHLPFNRNGLKFFDKDGGLEKADIRAILEDAGQTPYEPAPFANIPRIDFLSDYANYLCTLVRKAVACKENPLHPLYGLHVVVDAGNGAGGFFVKQVLVPLGADTSGSQFLNPDGMFPNHMPNPEDSKAMEAICQATRRSGADLGLIFDTDVDRMSAVLSDGTPVNRDAIIALMAAVLAPEHPGETIVTDSVTSNRLTAFIEQTLGMRHHRFKRGYKNVINECRRLNESGTPSPLAIETSGHGALAENYYLDDGAYLAVRLLIAAARLHSEGRTLASLIEKLPPLCEDREYRLKILCEDFADEGGRILESFAEAANQAGIFVEPNSYEGIRLKFEGDYSGWALLRLSLHDPVMPLNMEGDHPGDCEKILEAVRDLLKSQAHLDLSVLK